MLLPQGSRGAVLGVTSLCKRVVVKGHAQFRRPFGCFGMEFRVLGGVAGQEEKQFADFIFKLFAVLGRKIAHCRLLAPGRVVQNVIASERCTSRCKTTVQLM